MNHSSHSNRRQFLHRISLAATAAPLILSKAFAADGQSANDKIQLGFIGMGIMARGHLNGFLKYPDVQVMAVCDVHQQRREQAVNTVQQAYAKLRESGQYKGCTGYNDFRELLARSDIDAVVISTPDHWHAIPAIQAAAAKKDVYCEKPLSLTIGEARAMVKAARKNKIVFQTGSQQRSEFGGKFRTAAELIRNGRLGKLHTIRIGVGASPKPCDLPTQPKPDGVDWDLWLGPAPERGYNEILCPAGIHNHFPAWRNYREYAGGALADMGAHHFDIAQWALGMDESGPVEILPPARGTDTGLQFRYANGVTMIHGGPSGVTFEGANGTLYVDRGTITSNPESILKEPLGEKDIRLENSGGDHKRNWLDCIRSRKKPIADVEIGARTASVCHLANIGYELRRPLKWDPKDEKFKGDAEANKLISRETRGNWKV